MEKKSYKRQYEDAIYYDEERNILQVGEFAFDQEFIMSTYVEMTGMGLSGLKEQIERYIKDKEE